MRNIFLVLTLLAASVVAGHSAAAQTSDFQWSGAVDRDKAIEVRGVNGSIRAVASDDGVVHVEATRRARRSDPESVRIESFTLSCRSCSSAIISFDWML